MRSEYINSTSGRQLVIELGLRYHTWDLRSEFDELDEDRAKAAVAIVDER